MAASVKRRNDITNAAVFTQFIEHCTTAISLVDLAKRNGVSRATMKRRFKWCWLVDVPDPTARRPGISRSTAGGWIVAATIDHDRLALVQTRNRLPMLLERIEVAVIDGGQAHTAQSKVLADASSTPNAWSAATPPPTHAPMPGAPSTDLRSRITTDSPRGVCNCTFSTIYREWMNEKTMIKDPKTGAWTRVGAYNTTIFGGPRCCLSTSTRPGVLVASGSNPPPTA